MMSVNRVAVMQMINLAGKSSHRFLYLQHTADDFASRQKTSLDFFSPRKHNPLMQEINSEAVLKEFGQRAQRCFGCFVAYRLRDMYLGEDATFYCNYCLNIYEKLHIDSSDSPHFPDSLDSLDSPDLNLKYGRNGKRFINF
ncbi:MAG: hypothetical protein M3367_18845 [Acidobacteriota bacterium]|nr:hypothetical protein [Acidobacteriota bacterium]